MKQVMPYTCILHPMIEEMDEIIVAQARAHAG